MRKTTVAELAVVGPDHLVLAFAVDERDAKRVLAVGGQRRDLMLLSEDAGNSWATLTSPGKGLRGAFVDGPLLWIVGEYGFVAVSQDAGHTWKTIDIGFGGCLFGVTRDEHGTIIIAGDGGFIAACRDDVTFKPVSGVKVSLSRLYKCRAGVFIPTDNPGDIIHVTSTITKGEPKLKPVRRAIGAGGDLMTTTMAANGTMVVVGAAGAIFRSTDQGETWTKSTSPTTQLLTGVCALSSGRFVAVGGAGTIIVSDDDGVSFTSLEVAIDGKMLWACVAVGDDVFIGGEAGRVFRLREGEVPTTTSDVPAARGARSVVAGVLISDALRAMVFPWRGGRIAQEPPSLPTAAEAWRVVRQEMFAADRWRSTTLERPSAWWGLRHDPKSVRRRLAARLEDEAPRVGSAKDDAELVSLTYEDGWASFDSRARDNALVDLLVVQHGVVEATKRVFAGLRDKLNYGRMGVFERLRERIVTSSDSDYAAVLALALPMIESTPVKNSYDELPPALRSAWAFVLPLGERPHDIEREVLKHAASTIGEFGSSRIATPGVLASVDDGAFERFLRANKEPRHQFFSGGSRAYIATALARGLPSLLERLSSMRPRYDINVNVWSFLLAHVDSDNARELLMGEGGLTTLGARVSCALDPQRFFATVQAKKQSGDDVTKLEQIMATATVTQPEPVAPPVPAGPITPSRGVLKSALPPIALTVPAPLDLDPEFTWRDEEREAAEQAEPYEGHWRWQADDDDSDTVPPLKGASAALFDAWVSLRERDGVPTESAAYVLAPLRLHARLLALGAAGGEGRYSHDRSALLKNPDTIVAARAWLGDDSADLGARLTLVLPVGDVYMVPVVVAAFAGKKHKALARTWIVRHPRHAAAGALAMIAADTSAANAARVLRFVDGIGHRRTIVQLAATVDLTDRVQVLLDEDPLAQGVKPPTVPAWAKAQALPALVDSDGTAWTTERTDALIVRMAASNPDEVNPVVTAARASLDKKSAAAFARAMFEAWMKSPDAKHAFAMQALGFFGDDDGIRHLATLAKVWPGESAAARAQQALDVFVLHGGDSALLQLALIAEKSKFAALKKGAGERITAIADVRGLTADELADRLVPTFDLNDESAVSINFGARQFSVTFDEALVPRVKDATGALLKDLPKPNKSDDAALAAASKKRFMGLKKDVKIIADLLLRRFERMMIEGRAVDVDVFESCFVSHPLTFHVARRVLWQAEHDGVKTLFRIAEDRSFADLNDDAFALPNSAIVRPVHPLDLDDQQQHKAVALWGDYELLQPFPQLGRPRHRLGQELSDAATAKELSARDGRTTTAPALVFGLEGRQWRRYDIVDGGAFNSHVKDFGDVRAIVWYDGAVGMGFIEATETLTVRGVSFSSKKTKQQLTLGDVPARALSEVVVDLDIALSK